jgi:SAM-dependent methyltransferase
MTSFREYSDTYEAEVEHAIRFIGQGVDLFTEVKAAEILRIATCWLGPTERLELLDVGCGPGVTDAHLTQHVAGLTGVDPSPELLERAARDNPDASYVVSDGRTLPFPDASFDLAFAICVVHHVSPAEWGVFAAELARVTRPGGLVLIIEHNPANPLTRLAVARCEFDDDAVLLGPKRVVALLEAAGLRVVSRRYILFLPWRRSVFRRIERYLARVPVGAQYIVAGTTPG